MRRRRRGFTLIELMVVIAIIGMLATVTALGLGHIIGESMRVKVQADFKVLTDAIDLYRLKTKKSPQRLEDLVTAGVVEKLRPDPWGNPYRFTAGTGGKRGVISSYGSDGAPGGTGEAQDLTTENIDSVLASR